MTLSDKILLINCKDCKEDEKIFEFKDVKEFIRLLKKGPEPDEWLSVENFERFIDKLAGDELI